MPVAATISVFRGTALDDEGRPLERPSDLLAAAGLSVASVDRLAATARADGDGWFVVSHLAAGSYGIVAAVADGRRAVAWTRVGGENASVRLEIPAGSLEVTGRAVGPDWAPWHGRVGLLALADTKQVIECLGSLRMATTDAEGRFRLAGVESGSYLCAAFEGDTIAAIKGPFPVPRDGDVVIFVAPLEYAVEGVVVERGTAMPIASATVESVWEEEEIVVARATTGPDGRFRVTSPPGCVLVASAPGHASARAAPKADAKETRIVLAPSARIAGRVVGTSDGKPVEGAVVVLRAGTPVNRRTNEPTTRTRSGPDGRFEFAEAPSGEAEIAVAGGGWATPLQPGSRFVEPRFALAVAGETLELELAAVRVGAVDGRVVGVDGTPESQVRVQCSVDGAGGCDSLVPFCAGEAHTDSEGRFHFAPRVPGLSYVVEASVAGTAVASAIADVTEGSTASVELRLPPLRRLSIRVVGPESAGVSHALVSLDSPEAPRVSGASRERSKTSDDQGVATFEGVAPGPAFVRAQTQRDPRLRPSAWMPISVESVENASPEIQMFEVALERGLSIRGRVRWAESEPPRDDPFEYVQVDAGRADPGVRVGADGGFELDGLPPGRFDLVARAGVETVGINRAAAGDRDVVIELSRRGAMPSHSLRLRPIVPRGSTPPPMVGEWWVAGQLVCGDVDARDDGDFEIVTTEIGPFFIAIGAAVTDDDAPPTVGSVIVGPIDSTSDRVIEVRLPGPALPIAGRVVGEGGEPVVGVRVEAEPALAAENEPEFPRLMAGFDQTTVTDTQGRFAVHPRFVGRQRIHVWPGAGFEKPDPVEVDPGAGAVEIRVRRGRAVRLTVLDADGKPAPGATVWASFESSDAGRSASWEQLSADGAGSIDFTTLRRLPLRFRASPARDSVVREWASTEIRLAPSAVEATLHLPRPGRIRVHVQDAPRDFVRGHFALVGDDSEAVRKVVNVHDGVAELSPVAPDVVYAFWAGPTPEGDFLWRRDLHAGDDVEVRAERGATIAGRVLASERLWGSAGVDEAGIGASGLVSPDGSFEIRGVPRGSWPVRARVWGDSSNCRLEGTATATPGTPVEIRIGK